MSELTEELRQRVDTIEASYELMLAYAAQGVPSDKGSANGAQLREQLTRFSAALSGLDALYREWIAAERPDQQAAGAEFLEVLARDAAAAGAGIRLVLAQPAISSQLIDNLNASIHVRALLTDIFLIDEATKGPHQ